MGDIFAGTECVIVWLGKDTTDLEDFVWIHGEAWPAIETKVRSQTSNSAQPNPMDPGLLFTLGLTPHEWVARWQSCGRFYRTRRWFARPWIVQEVALARRITVRCAHHTLSFKSMQALAFGGVSW